ncbi:hypothetical protein KPL71_009551 [Citrus sinensis]|uniref:Uncharacterized protein n=1 Tax=Citrus sinensis TaxID=2711 RepID=A0ACB8MEB8_CITSI|nr:hypothetical protein KPL71_009551 [Citrus sinensis]
MASSSLLLLQLQPLNSLSSTSHNTLLFHQNTHYIPPLKVSAKPFLSSSKPLTVLFALTESDSPKSLQPDSQTLLQELADSFDLPSDYLAQLPRDLRLDLNDAAFDLSNGPVVDEERKYGFTGNMGLLGIREFSKSRARKQNFFSLVRRFRKHMFGTKYLGFFPFLPFDKLILLRLDLFLIGSCDAVECGQELGELLLNLTRAWEQADSSTSHSLVKKLPALESSLTDNAKSGKIKSICTFGKRLISAGRRFQAMGQYGQGELQKNKRRDIGQYPCTFTFNGDHCLQIAKAMTAAGKLLSASSISTTIDEQPKKETRMLKVEVTPEKAYIGAAIGFVFGILSWELGQGIQSTPESSLQYANDNALLLAKVFENNVLFLCDLVSSYSMRPLLLTKLENLWMQSLRGALLAACYSSTLLSVFTVIGLFLYGRQLASKEK